MTHAPVPEGVGWTALMTAQARARESLRPDPLVVDPWAGALRAAGFRPEEPAAWLAEGLLMYLDAADADRLLATIVAASAPGSGVACEYFARPVRLDDVSFGPDVERGQFTSTRSMFRSGPDAVPAQWFPRHGLELDRDTDVAAELRAHGREVPPMTGGDGRADPVVVRWRPGGCPFARTDRSANVGAMARASAPGTRERILSVASRLFYAHGVRAVGMNRIIAEASTGKNLLYQHFPAKSDLVAAYLARAGERRRDGAQRARDAAGDDPRDQLVATVAEVAALVGRPWFRGCAFRNYLAEFPDDAVPDDAPAAVAHDFLTESRERLAELAARTGAADPELLTERLWLIVDGLYLQSAYRDRLGSAPAGDVAVELARRLVEAA